VELLIRLKRDLYADFSVRHFYEQVTEKHQVKVSYKLAATDAAGSFEVESTQTLARESYGIEVFWDRIIYRRRSRLPRIPFC
jgi:hypothetical protein